MKYLLIDIGSTNIKSPVWQGGEISVQKTPFPPPVRDDGVHFEVDPAGILSRVREIVDDTDCDAVFFSVQMHGWLLADGAGRLLTPYISWQDRRAGAAGISLAVPKESGTSMKPNLPRAGVAAFAAESPQTFARAVRFFTLGSYLVYAFTGRNATHITDAAASGFYDVKGRTAAACGLSLPEASYDVRPVGLYRGRRIYTPCGDQQCSVLGAGGGENRYVLNLGTAAQMCTAERGFAAGNFESRPWFGGNTLCTVTGLSGGKVLGEGKKDAASLAEEYLAAAARLPERKEMLVTGGAVRWHRAVLEAAFGKMGIPYAENEGADALEGLKILALRAEKERAEAEKTQGTEKTKTGGGL